MALAIRQHPAGGHDATSSTTNTLTFGSGILSGSIVVLAYHWDAGGGATTLSDTSADSPSYAFSTNGIYDGNSILLEVGAFFAPTSGVTAFTANLANAIDSHLEGWEITGFTAGTASFDKTNSTTGQAASPVLSGTTGVLSQAQEFAVGYATDYSAFNGVGAGWTDDGRSSFLFNAQVMDQITAATTSINANATSAGPVFATAIVATVQGTISGGGGGSPLRRNSSLSGLGASGPFFHDPLSGRSQTGWRPSLILPPRKRILRTFDRIAA